MTLLRFREPLMGVNPTEHPTRRGSKLAARSPSEFLAPPSQAMESAAIPGDTSAA